MKIMALVAHPKISESRLHRTWSNALEDTTKVSVRKLYHVYPYWRIDTQAEQALLPQYDRIILQFPFYLYGCPPLMKLWIDEVLTFRWAYGPGGNALRGKQIMLAISTGGPAESYEVGGYHNYTVGELLLPFRQIVNLIGGHYLKPHVFHRTRNVSDIEIADSAREYARYAMSTDIPVLPAHSAGQS